ncbi:MAG TPA: hypothetical protein VF064_14130 [Pyrinomonadaceae bacterium]
MSDDTPRKADQPAYRKSQPRLRLVKSPEAPPQPAPDTGLRAVLDDMNHRYRVQRERAGRDGGGKDAA